MIKQKEIKIGLIGLGYVGLPLAVEFGKKFSTIGFDINENRILELKNYSDRTLEVESKEIKLAHKLTFTSEITEISDCNIYIVTVPTPIDDKNDPDLSPLIGGCKTVASCLSNGNIVVFESTVYPGCTEEICVPILEDISGLNFNKDFYVGYSPERINPGDKTHRLPDIKKVTSGSTVEVANFIDDLYKIIIKAGTHKAESIKVAEAAKIIENTQRDVNIALINELAMIFERLEIDTEDVLRAARSKWNFLPFKPGLVGGHCIGVDPYYLTFKAKAVGHNPEIILAGRKINDGMGKYVARRIVKLFSEKNRQIKSSKVLILGATFKENCPDMRNSRVADLAREIETLGGSAIIHDPYIEAENIPHEFKRFRFEKKLRLNYYDAIILAVSHQQFIDLGIDKIKKFGNKNAIIFDIKSVFNQTDVDGRL